MTSGMRKWLVRLGLSAWGLLTVFLAYKVVDYADWLSDQEIGAIGLEQSSQVLRSLAVPLARDRSKQDLLVLIRRTVPDHMVVATDSSIGVDELTFRFDSAGRLTSIDPEYAP